MSKNKDRGLSDLIPIALFIVGWIILGQIDKHNPGSGKSILVAIL